MNTEDKTLTTFEFKDQVNGRSETFSHTTEVCVGDTFWTINQEWGTITGGACEFGGRLKAIGFPCEIDRNFGQNEDIIPPRFISMLFRDGMDIVTFDRLHNG